MSTVLQLRALDVGYPDRTILRGISLQACRGERILISGANGAGKSTLLRTIAGIQRPVAGEVFLMDIQITNLSLESRAKAGILYLFQGRRVFEDLTLRENLWLAALQNKKIYARSESLLGRFGAADLDLSRPARELSGGWARILALAGLLARQPRVLLLDEPLAGLSAEAADNVMSLLRSYESDSIVLMIEHAIDKVGFVCQRRLHIVDGGIHEQPLASA